MEASRLKLITYITYPFLLGSFNRENIKINEKIDPTAIINFSVNSFM